MIDIEVRKLIDTAYNNAKDLLEANRDKIEALAMALLKYETLDAEDVKIVIAGGQLEKPTLSELLAKEERKSESENTDKEPDEDSDTDPFPKINN